MAPRSGIIAGKTVIVVQVQESIDSALTSISSKLNKFSAKVGRLGLELFSGGLLGSLIGKQITDQFKEFEDRILFLRTKLVATDREFSILESRIRELGRTTSFTAIEVAEGATILAQAGLSAKESAEALQSTLDLARGAQIELGQSGAILVNTMRSFGIETTKANEVASQLIAAARLGTLDVLDLKESIKEVLGTVRTLNIDLPTTLALLTQMAERSLKGTKAGTSLNTALLNLASKSQVLKDTLGIALPDNIDGESFIDFLEKLYNRINRLGNLQRVSILQQLFNIRGGRAITALDDIGKIVRLQREIRGAGDEARKAAKVMDSGFGGSVRRATSAVESLGITLGKVFTKVLTPIVDTIPAFSNALEKLAISNEMMVLSIAATPPLLLGLGAGLLTLSFVGGKAAAIIGGLGLSFRALSNAGLAAVNAQLITLTKSMNTFFGRVQRQGKGANITKKGGLFQQFDELLSATFLSPQKVGGRGRNAGKTRPTSFASRVGSAGLSFTKIGPAITRAFTAANAAVDVFGRKLDTLLNSSERRFGSFLTALAKPINSLGKYNTVYKGLSSSINTATRNIGNLLAALRSVNSQIDAGIIRLNKYNALSKQFAQGALASIDAEDRQTNLRNRLGQVDSEFNTLLGAPTEGKRTKANKALEKQRIARIAALGAERKAILDQLEVVDADIEGMAKKSDYYKVLAKQEAENIGNLKRQRAGFAASLKQQKQQLGLFARQRQTLVASRRLQRGVTFGNVLGGIRAGVARAASAVLSAVISLVQKSGKTLVTFFRQLPRLLDNSITGLFKFFKAAGGFAAGLFRIVNGVRRFVFSLSGLLTIVELLILFGPKIGFIRDAFARLGKGIGDAFQTIRGTFSDLSPVFSLFGQSFGAILSGDGELGIRGLINGFKELAVIVKSNLKIAFLQVVEAIAPLYDFIKNITLSLLEVLSLIGGIAGTTLGNIGAGIQGVTGGGAGGALSGIGEAIKQAFSKENIKAAFTFVGAFFVEIARSINNILRDIFLVINNLASFIQTAITRAFGFIANSSASAASGLSGDGLSGVLKLILAEISIGARGAADALEPSLNANREAADKIANSFESGSKRLDEIFTNFVDRLGNIFSDNTEEQSKQGQENAKREREAAQERARKEEKNVRTGNTVFTGIGSRIGNFLNGGAASLATRGVQGIGSLFSSNRQAPNFQALGQFGSEAIKKGLEKLQSDPTGRSQERIRKAKIKELQLDQKASIANNKRRARDNQQKLVGLFSSPNLSSFIGGLAQLETGIGAGNASADAARRDRADRIRELRRRVRDTGRFDSASLRDIVSATVGTFQQTRGNLLKVAGGKSVDQQQLDALQTIVTNTGGPNNNLFNVTNDLAKRAQPFVFQ